MFTPQATNDDLGRELLTITLTIVRFLCGWAVLYVVVGGLIGFAFGGPPRPELGCLPHSSDFGVLESQCDNSGAKWFWYAIVGWPREMLIPPAVALALVFAFVKAALNISLAFGEELFLAESVLYFVLSMPLALAACGSAWYWWRRSRAFAVVQVAALLGEIVHLALQE